MEDNGGDGGQRPTTGNRLNCWHSPCHSHTHSPTNKISTQYVCVCSEELMFLDLWPLQHETVSNVTSSVRLTDCKSPVFLIYDRPLWCLSSSFIPFPLSSLPPAVQFDLFGHTSRSHLETLTTGFLKERPVCSGAISVEVYLWRDTDTHMHTFIVSKTGRSLTAWYKWLRVLWL